MAEVLNLSCLPEAQKEFGSKAPCDKKPQFGWPAEFTFPSHFQDYFLEQGVKKYQLDGVDLKPEEKYCLVVYAQGVPLEKMAKDLQYSVNTIRNLKKKALAKIGCNDLTTALDYSLNSGLIEIDELVPKTFQLESFRTSNKRGLTEREQELGEYITSNGEKSSSKEIAKALGISRRTVDNHFINIANKFNLGKTAFTAYYLAAQISGALNEPNEEKQAA